MKEQASEQLRELTSAEVNSVSGGSITRVIMSVWSGPSIDSVRGVFVGSLPGLPGGGIGVAGLGLGGVTYVSAREDS